MAGISLSILLNAVITVFENLSLIGLTYSFFVKASMTNRIYLEYDSNGQVF